LKVVEHLTGFDRSTVKDRSVNRNSALARMDANRSGLYGMSSVDHCRMNTTRPRTTLNASSPKKIADGMRTTASTPKRDRAITELNIANSFCTGLNATMSGTLLN